MDTFRDFIKSLFVENEYIALGAIDIDDYFVKHKCYEDYWVIAEGIINYQKQEEIFQKLQSKYYSEHPLAEKNTSLLILHDMKVNELEKNAIIEIENDPLYFKKYVLCYSQESHVKLSAMLNASSVSDLAMSEGVFNMMMKENNLGPASLLYNIMHKLPIIPLKYQPMGMIRKDLSFPGTSNAGQLIEFLNGLPDDEQKIDRAVCNLIKAEHHEETGD